MGVEVGIRASFSNAEKSLCTIRQDAETTVEQSQTVDELIEADIAEVMPECRTFQNIRVCYLGSLSLRSHTRVFCSSNPCRVGNSNKVVAAFHEAFTADLAKQGIPVETRGPTPDSLRGQTS